MHPSLLTECCEMSCHEKAVRNVSLIAALVNFVWSFRQDIKDMNQSGKFSLMAIAVSSMPPLLRARRAIGVIIRSHFSFTAKRISGNAEQRCAGVAMVNSNVVSKKKISRR